MRGQGQKLSYPKKLEKLVAWILEKREIDCVPISTQLIRCKALCDFPLDYMCNMDETPIFLNLLPSKIIDKKGKKTISVRTTASEKNRITATLCCTASGKMLLPFVIFKESLKKDKCTMRCCMFHSG